MVQQQLPRCQGQGWRGWATRSVDCFLSSHTQHSLANRWATIPQESNTRPFTPLKSSQLRASCLRFIPVIFEPFLAGCVCGKGQNSSSSTGFLGGIQCGDVIRRKPGQVRDERPLPFSRLRSASFWLSLMSGESSRLSSPPLAN